MSASGITGRWAGLPLVALLAGASLVYAQPSTPSRPSPIPTLDPQNPFGIEHPTVTQLVEKLRDPDWRVRYYAAMWLGNEGQAATEAVPSLIVALRDPNQEVRCKTAYALGSMGSRAPEVIPALLERLKAEEPADREAAAQALYRIGPPPEAADALLESIDKDDYGRGARAAAVGALARTGVSDRVVLRLATLLRDKESGVRDTAKRALLGMGAQAQRALPELIAVIEGSNYLAQRAAAEVLAHMGPAAGPAIPSLFGMLEQDDPGLRHGAAAAIRAIRSARWKRATP
jgi:HEAT repeat protein